MSALGAALPPGVQVAEAAPSRADPSGARLTASWQPTGDRAIHAARTPERSKSAAPNRQSHKPCDLVQLRQLCADHFRSRHATEVSMQVATMRLAAIADQWYSRAACFAGRAAVNR
jgi:hypothetical protein